MKRFVGLLAALVVLLVLNGCKKDCTHEYSCRQTKPRTCTEDGLNTYSCIHCDATYTEPVPACGHSYGEGIVETEATYDKEGTLLSTCRDCGDQKREAIHKLVPPPYKEGCASKA